MKPKLSATLTLLLLGLHAAHAVTFQILDPVEFGKIINTNAILTTNATINAWLEGPVWIPSGGGYLLFCDQGGNKLKKLVLPNTVTDFIAPLTGTVYNGTMLDAEERLIACQAGTNGLRIVMVTNNVVTVLVSNCNGLKFYSPNDVTVKSDGTIWFTDPAYNGYSFPRVGFAAGLYVYSFNPTSGECVAVITNGISKPNGLCFSPDETKLYVADTQNRNIRVYSVSASNTLSGGSVFATLATGNGNPDGIRCDVDGRVWSSAGNGVHIFATDGHLIGKILFNQTANLCFGGAQYKTLYMTGQPVVTSIPVLVAGTPSLKNIRANTDGSQLNLTWPAPSTGFELQETEELGSSANWTNSDLAAVVTNGQNLVSVETTNVAKFFRLRLN